MSQPKRKLAARREPRSVTPADTQVGIRIRMRRISLGMSQTALASAIGVTFQQVQKYENGKNRVGAGRLHHVAFALEIPVAWFFEDLHQPLDTLSEPTKENSDFARFKQSRYAPEIVRSFVRLSNRLQRNLALLISQIAAERS